MNRLRFWTSAVIITGRCTEEWERKWQKEKKRKARMDLETD